MIDTWSTVGSCAQIGKRVHISGGVGNWRRARAAAGRTRHHRDDCFIGARSEVAEGVIVAQGRGCWRWACSWAPQPRSSIATAAKVYIAKCRNMRWWCRDRGRPDR